jgi:hypothetical protein
MLRQSLESQSDQFFVTEGRHVQLGTWRDLRHTNTRDRAALDSYMRFNVDVTTPDLPSGDIQAMWQASANSQIVNSEGDKYRIQLRTDRDRAFHPKTSPATSDGSRAVCALWKAVVGTKLQ